MILLIFSKLGERNTEKNFKLLGRSGEAENISYALFRVGDGYLIVGKALDRIIIKTPKFSH